VKRLSSCFQPQSPEALVLDVKSRSPTRSPVRSTTSLSGVDQGSNLSISCQQMMRIRKVYPPLTLKLLVGRGWSNFLGGLRNCQTSCSNPFCGKLDSQKVRHFRLISRPRSHCRGCQKILTTDRNPAMELMQCCFQRFPKDNSDGAMQRSDKRI
jgi:hypothetical protein